MTLPTPGVTPANWGAQLNAEIQALIDRYGLVLHLAADSITGVADTVAIELWRDKSGRSNHVQNTTSGERPVFRTSQINSLPIVRFDTTDDQLMAIAASPLDKHLVKPFTIFSVVKTPAVGAPTAHIWGKGGSAGALDLYFATTTNITLNMDMSAVAGILTSSNLTASTYYVIEVTYSEVGVFAAFANGTSIGSGTNNQTFVPGVQHVIGYHSGLDIAEFMMYDRVLDSTTRAAIRATLGAKYAITVV